MSFDQLLYSVVELNFFLLIIGGCVAASWLLIRLVSVTDSENISSITNKIALLGFPIGIISLVLLGGAFYLDSIQQINLPQSFDFATLICLLILGLVLILRPIKDFRFGTIISLALGLLGAAIIVFLGANEVKIIAGVFILIFLLIYGSIRLIEDLYLLIAEILANPIISVSVGVICIIQGILEVFGTSLAVLFQFLG